MYYPPFLKPGDTIGIFAPSSGINPDAPERFELSLSHLKEEGYRIYETDHVRTGLHEASSPETRAREFKQVICDKNAKMAFAAAGGEYLISMLPYVDFDAIRDNPKLIAGFSDPTGLLFPITTKLDIATLYGTNAGNYSMTSLHPCLRNALDFIAGKWPEQHNFDLYEAEKIDGMDGYNLTTSVEYKTPNGPVDVTGRLLGGCMDVFLELIGTPYAPVPEFVEKYKDDGIIWYFDVFALPTEEVYRTLWHMREAGWLKYAKAFLFGRVRFPRTLTESTYEDDILKFTGNQFPVVTGMDIGHVNPRFTLVNGAMAHVTARDGKGTITQWAE